jgi:hypothetical protein
MRAMNISRLLASLLLVALALPASAAVEVSAYHTKYTGTGTNDNDVVIQTNSVDQFDAFCLFSTAGAMDVFVSLDGTNYATEALSLQDFGAVDNNPVVVTAASRIYCFVGKFKTLRVLQNGATAVTAATMNAWKMGS